MEILVISMPGKCEALKELLSKGMVTIHLDARRPGVVVPKSFSKEAHLRLNLSHKFHIPDLEIDELGVRATLSFQGQGFHCQILWMALFAMTPHNGDPVLLWRDDLPPELENMIQEEATPQEAPELSKLGLHLVPPEKEESPASDNPKSKDEDPQIAERPYLRLVK